MKAENPEGVEGNGGPHKNDTGLQSIEELQMREDLFDTRIVADSSWDIKTTIFLLFGQPPYFRVQGGIAQIFNKFS